ncbi:MAG: glycerate kinase [Oscillospiraceae bacterium]|jgi:glycerate kinase
MRILFASDSFKGALTSSETITLLKSAAEKVFPDCETIGVPVADGGEGTTEAVVKATGGSIVSVKVHGPLMEEETAYYGALSGGRAVFEMASASGLPLVPRNQRNPMKATSYGTGELMSRVLDDGYRKISVAVGGSATNDGGMGFASALGVRFLDKDGNVLAGTGENLIKIRNIDVSGIKPELKDAEISVMCDVRNPLCGPEGASRVYGPQKGARGRMIEELEAGMENYRDVVKRQFGIDLDECPGSGAAGGLSSALMVFAGAKLCSGIDSVLDLIGFDKLLEGTDLCITGEGRTDRQSAYGKVLQGVGDRAKAHGVPVIALSGSVGEGYYEILSHGIDAVLTTVDRQMTLSDALREAGDMYSRAAEMMFRTVKTGMDIQKRLSEKKLI